MYLSGDRCVLTHLSSLHSGVNWKWSCKEQSSISKMSAIRGMVGEAHVATAGLETEVDKGARVVPAEQEARAGPTVRVGSVGSRTGVCSGADSVTSRSGAGSRNSTNSSSKLNCSYK